MTKPFPMLRGSRLARPKSATCPRRSAAVGTADLAEGRSERGSRPRAMGEGFGMGGRMANYPVIELPTIQLKIGHALAEITTGAMHCALQKYGYSS